MIARAAVIGVLAAACGAPSAGPPDAPVLADAADGDGGFVCPWGGVRGSGRHRLFLQGHGGVPDADGVYPMLHEWAPDGGDAPLCDDSIFVNDTNGDGIWEPGEEPKPLGPSALVHGEHFLVGVGAYVEFSITLCDDITGEIGFYVANFDVTGSQSMHQLFVVHQGEEQLIAQATDEEPGNSGYNPFIRLMTGVDPDVTPGDRLLMRTTNLNGYQYSVMVWQPPSEYESWVLVNVP